MSEPTPPAPQRPAPERRVSVRYPCRFDTFCQKGLGRSDHFWWFAKAVDLSADGICIVVQGGFPPDTMLSVELSNPSGDFTVTLPAKVVRSTREASGWIIGCSFTRPLTDAELEALL